MMQNSQFASMIQSVEVIDDLPEHQYHEETGLGDGKWLTRSMICDYIDSPSGFELRHICKDKRAQRKPSSDSMKLGSYLDVMITEGEQAFYSKYVVPSYERPNREWFTASGSVSKKKEVQESIAAAICLGEVYEEIPETVRAWEARLPHDQERLCEKTFELASYMASRLQTNALAKAIIDGHCGKQLTIRAVLNNGLRIQCRIDLTCEGYGIVADLKTTNRRKERFMKSAVAYGYHVQGWLYHQLAIAAGLKVKHDFLFVCQMNCYPWDPYVISLREEVYEWSGKITIAAIDGIQSKNYGEHQTDAYVPLMEYWLANIIDNEG
jgi:hypothetical protein